MTDTVEEDCPVCNSSDSAKAQFAAAKVAEHMNLVISRSTSSHRGSEAAIQQSSLNRCY